MDDIISKNTKTKLSNKQTESDSKQTVKRALKQNFFNRLERKRLGNNFKKFSEKEKNREKPLKVNKTLSRIKSWILSTLVFLLPLWFLPWGVDKIGMAKQLLMTILLGIGFIIWLYEGINKGKFFYRRSVINIGIWLLLVAIIISTFFSLSPTISFYASSANFANLWNFIFLGIFYLLVSTNKGEKKHKGFNLLNVFLISTGLVIFYTFLSVLGLNFLKSILNPVGSVNSVAILAGLAIVIVLSKLSLEENKKQKNKEHNIILISTTVLSFIFLLLANLASVWYGLILAMVILIITKIKREKDVQVKSFTFPIVILVVSLVFLFWGIFGARIGLEQPKINLKNLPIEVSPSFQTSIQIAGKTLNQKTNFRQMFFGVGLGNFSKTWLLYHPLDLNQTDFWQLRFYQSYSSFTTWMIETGYFGIISALFLFIVVLFYGTKKKKNFSDEIVNSYLFIPISYMILMWFLSSFNLTLYFAFFLLIALLIKNNPQKKVDLSSPIQKALIFSLSSILVIIMMFFAGYFNIQRYVSDIMVSKGVIKQTIDTKGLKQNEIITKAQNALDKRLNILIDAYKIDKSNDNILRLISQTYLSKINLTLQNKDKNISNYAQNALIYARKAIEVDKTEYQNYTNLARVYENLIPFSGDAYNLAILNYKKALELNPKDPSLVFDMARSQFSEVLRLANSANSLKNQPKKDEVKKKQENLLTQAIKNLNEAITLKINYTPAHQLLAQIYEVQGKVDKAIVSASNLVILNPQDANLWFGLGLLYYKNAALKNENSLTTKNNEILKAEKAFNQAIALKDDYSNARYFLGLTYYAQGKKDNAIAQFEKVAKLNPDNKEVKTILENLKAGKNPLEGMNSLNKTQ